MLQPSSNQPDSPRLQGLKFSPPVPRGKPPGNLGEVSGTEEKGPPPGPPEWIFRARNLDELEKLAFDNCTLCARARSRKGFLFGRGKEDRPDAMIVLDPQSEKVFKDGNFPRDVEREWLSELLNSGIKLDEKNVYVTPSIKCVLPRTDGVTHRAMTCCGYLAIRQASLLRPLAVASFGKTAAGVMSMSRMPLGILRAMRRVELSQDNWKSGLWMTFGLNHICSKGSVARRAYLDMKSMASEIRKIKLGMEPGT
jgi:uracil-DNA glycosylase